MNVLGKTICLALGMVMTTGSPRTTTCIMGTLDRMDTCLGHQHFTGAKTPCRITEWDSQEREEQDLANLQ